MAIANYKEVIINSENTNSVSGYIIQNGEVYSGGSLGYRCVTLYTNNIRYISFSSPNISEVPMIMCRDKFNNLIQNINSEGLHLIKENTIRIDINFFGSEYATEFTLVPKSNYRAEYKLLCVNTSPDEDFITKIDDTKNLLINTIGNKVVSTYSNVLLFHENKMHFTNIRASNIELGDGYIGVLSKSPSELERFNDISELPYGSPNSNAYIYPLKFASYSSLADAWDVLFYNYNGQLINFIPTNDIFIKEKEDDIITNSVLREEGKKGLYEYYDNFPNEGYIKPDGTYASAINTGWGSTDFISVIPGLRIIGQAFNQAGATSFIACYDKNYNFIENQISTSEETGLINFNTIIPENVYFIRIQKYSQDEISPSFLIIIPYASAILDETKINESPEIYKYKHSLKKPYNFRGKKATFFGDSVTYGVATNPWTNPFENCYRKLFCDFAGLIGTNRAISGSFIYDPNYNESDATTSSILSQVKTYITQDDFDFIFIAGGINDYIRGHLLGSINDIGNISFYGALKSICNHIKTNAPSANVIFLTPINCTWGSTNNIQYNLDFYRNAIAEVAIMNDFSVVDMSVINFPVDLNNLPFREAIIADGVHPTALGYKMMAENLYSILGE